jgi:hypothetical protein
MFSRLIAPPLSGSSSLASLNSSSIAGLDERQCARSGRCVRRAAGPATAAGGYRWIARALFITANCGPAIIGRRLPRASRPIGYPSER